MKPSEAFREAKCVLFERDWAQHTFGIEGGSVCALGAIGVALTGDELGWLDQGSAIITTLRRAIGGPITLFNDAPGRTFDEVIDAFDKAEKLAEQAEALDA